MNWNKSKTLMIIIATMFIMLVPTPEAGASQNTVVSWSTAVNGDADIIMLSRPSGTREGEFLLAQITYEKGIDAWPITAPMGWKHIITTDAYHGGGYKDIGQALYWKIAGKDEPDSYTWRFGQEVEALGGIISYTGIDKNDPVAASIGRGGYGESTGQNHLNAPGLTAARGTKLVGFYGIKERANLDTPMGMKRLYQERDDENDYTILAVEEIVSQHGTTGDRVSYSWEYDNLHESVEAEWVSHLVVLRVASTPTIPTDVTVEKPSREILVYIDQKLLLSDDKPTIEEGRALVPMRAFFEALGAEVYWDSASRTAVGIRAGIIVRIAINNATPTVNGITKTIDVPARIINSRTYIPLRFVGEALGDGVVWNDSTRSIYITRK